MRSSRHKPRIFIAYTGGTIGMKATGTGFQPEPGYLQSLLAEIPQFRRPEVPQYEIQEFSPLLDSANMTPEHWLRIAQLIHERYADYDGFLVIHGTDTMAYTASALSFMLEGLSKPVILTGSQIPLFDARNDAQKNLLASLVILGQFHQQLAEVFIYFDDQLLRGNRATKVDSDSFAAFTSPNLPPIARVGVDIEINWDLVRPPVAATRHIIEIGKATVGAFRLFPGMRAEYMANLLRPPVQGVVLECYGSGNAPSNNRPLIDALGEACARGVVVVAVTQTLRGSADLTLYATGRALLDAGVTCGFDMTPEAALAKLYYLFEGGHDSAEVRRMLQMDLRGELSALSRQAPGADSQRVRGTQRYRGL